MQIVAELRLVEEEAVAARTRALVCILRLLFLISIYVENESSWKRVLAKVSTDKSQPTGRCNVTLSIIVAEFCIFFSNRILNCAVLIVSISISDIIKIR